MAKQRKTAHSALDELRQAAADERMKQRELETAFEAAKVAVEQASATIAHGYAAEDQRAVTASRKAEEAAVAQVKDLQHRLTGAEIRVERAQHEADSFARERARDLLDERAADARELAAKLMRGGHELVQLHRAYIAMRSDIDSLVGAVPDADVRSDGPPPSYAWERQLRDLERVVRETPEVEPPLPTWAGLKDREQRDRTARLLQLRRRKRLTADEQVELDRINREQAEHPPAVTTLRSEQ